MIADTSPTPTNEVLTDERTGNQSPFQQMQALIAPGQSLLWGNGGTALNPCGIRNWGLPFGPRYWVYRQMLEYPTLAFVRMMRIAPILANPWKYAKADDAPDAWIEHIEEVFNAIRAKALADIVNGQDMGWAGFEPIWSIRDKGMYWIDELKPLSPDFTSILTNMSGRFVGLSASMQAEKGITFTTDTGQTITGLPAPYKAWLYTYNGKYGNLYGQSWLLNTMQAWKDALDTMQQLAKLSASISGTQCVITAPPSLMASCEALIKALSQGAPGGVIPSLLKDVKSGEQINYSQLAEIAKASPVSFELLKFGERTGAITGFLARIEFDNSMMFQGGLRSPRTGLEGKHGTKAEAQTHTDSGTQAAELDCKDIASQLQPMVDAVLTLNFGASAAGKVWIDPPPLEDSTIQIYSDLLKAMMANPAISGGIAMMLGTDGMGTLLNKMSVNVPDKAQFALVVNQTNSETDPPTGPDGEQPDADTDTATQIVKLAKRVNAARGKKQAKQPAAT